MSDTRDREGGLLSEFSGAFPAPTWTPPAREPFIPLRPLTLGQILAGAFRALRHNPAVTLGPAVIFSLVAALGATAVSRGVIDPFVERFGSSASTASGLYDWLVTFGAGLLSWIVAQSLVLAAGIPQQAVSATDVSHAVLGRRLTPGGLRRRTTEGGSSWDSETPVPSLDCGERPRALRRRTARKKAFSSGGTQK